MNENHLGLDHGQRLLRTTVTNQDTLSTSTLKQYFEVHKGGKASIGTGPTNEKHAVFTRNNIVHILQVIAGGKAIIVLKP